MNKAPTIWMRALSSCCTLYMTQESEEGVGVFAAPDVPARTSIDGKHCKPRPQRVTRHKASWTCKQVRGLPDGARLQLGQGQEPHRRADGGQGPHRAIVKQPNCSPVVLKAVLGALAVLSSDDRNMSMMREEGIEQLIEKFS